MWWQLVRRTAIFAVSAVAASIVVFALLTLVGDPARTVLGTDATEAAVAIMRHRMGLDRNIVTQYLSWAGGAIRGDFGTSYVTGFPIGPEIAQRLAITAWLVLGGIVVALAIAVPMGTIAALRHTKISGMILSGLSQLGMAIPAFLAGIVLIAVFAVWLGWLPSGSYTPPGVNPIEFLRGMLLPWLSLGLVQGAVLARYVRAAVLDELGHDYLRTARSKGLTMRQAMIRHGLRNAAIPVLTVLGVQLVTVIVGAVVVERVFVIPGIGSYLIDSVTRQDHLAVQGVVVVIVIVSLLVNFCVDVSAALIDPRLRRR